MLVLWRLRQEQPPSFTPVRPQSSHAHLLVELPGQDPISQTNSSTWTPSASGQRSLWQSPHFSWEEVIQTDCWVLEIIHQGYSIELLQIPQFKGVRSTPSPPAGPNILTEEVEDLLRTRALTPVLLNQEKSAFYSIYFLIPKRDEGHRPTLNLKYLNISVRKTLFMMETLRSIVAATPPLQWMASVDLKDAYFHIGVVQFLRFSWLGQAYQFEALPFGLSSAPRVFTKTLAPLIA